jgi:hypothetical protein
MGKTRKQNALHSGPTRAHSVVPVRRDAPSSRWTSPALGLLASIIGSLAAAWVFYRVGVARGPLLMWDEGGYVWRAHFTALGIRHLDLSMAWRAATADRLNPLLHPLLMAPAFLLFGDSERTAFAFGAVCLVVSALLVWWIAYELEGWIAAAVALACLLGSRLHLEYSATAMLEIPGTALTLLGVWLYLRHLRMRNPASGWIAGLALLAVFFYKYNYGIFLSAAVLANEALRRPFRPLSAATLGVWLPLVIGAAAWFLIPGKVQGFLDFAGNRDSGLGWLAAVAYYPRILIGYYAAWTVSGAFILLGAGAAVRYRQREEVRFILLFAAIGLVSMTFHRYKLERSITTVAPALWILCGVTCADLVRGLSRRGRSLGVTAAIALAAILLGGLPRLYARDLPAIARHIETGAPHRWSRFSWPMRDLLPARDLMLRGVDPRLPVYVAGEFNQLPPMAIQYWFAERYPSLPVVSQCFQAGNTPSPPLNLVTIEVLPTSRYFDVDYRAHNAWALEPIHAVESSKARAAIDTTLTHAGVRLRIYRLRTDG